MIKNLLKKSSFRIRCGNTLGTAFFISKNHLLTAYHCVLPSVNDEDSIWIEISASGDTKFEAQLIDYNEEYDVCLLKAEDPPQVLPVRLGKRIPNSGENWFSFGFPKTKQSIGHFIEGEIGQVVDYQNLKFDIDLSVSNKTLLSDYSGMSGAALVTENTISGIIRKTIDQSIGAVSIFQIQGFLRKNGITVSGDKEATPESDLAEHGGFHDQIVNQLLKNRGAYTFIEGPHGSGKTTFCREFGKKDDQLFKVGVYQLRDENNIFSSNYKAQPTVFYDWLSNTVSQLITSEPARKEPLTLVEIQQNIPWYLEQLSEHCRLGGKNGLLIIDGLNEISSEEEIHQFIGLLPTSIPSNLVIILTAVNYTKFRSNLAQRVQESNVLRIPPIPWTSCYEFCVKYLKNDDAVLRSICDRANGNPLYLRYLIEYVSNNKSSDLNSFPTYSGSIKDYYLKIWDDVLPIGLAPDVLAMMARLRSGIKISDFLKILDQNEIGKFLNVKEEIRHLLLDDKYTTIYHSSFQEFIIEKTQLIESVTNRRLAAFCIKNPQIQYCTKNKAHHLLEAQDSEVFDQCNQKWVDDAVNCGVDPDTLESDIENLLVFATKEGTAPQLFSALLLSQRVDFRYNTLFAQSADLISKALIALDNPLFAFKHIFRYGGLVVSNQHALKIAHHLVESSYEPLALEVLKLLQDRIIAIYPRIETLDQFVENCEIHLKTLILIDAAGGGTSINHVITILKLAKAQLESMFQDDPQRLSYYLAKISSNLISFSVIAGGSYTCFDKLGDQIKSISKENLFIQIANVLVQIENGTISYGISKSSLELTNLFIDLGHLLTSPKIDADIARGIVDTSIFLNAPYDLVEKLNSISTKTDEPEFVVTLENGVDLNYESLWENLSYWRTSAYLSDDWNPSFQKIIIDGTWETNLKRMFLALFYCDGRARKMGNVATCEEKTKCFESLRKEVLDMLLINLGTRVTWKNSYAIPEQAMPFMHGIVVQLLIDCFPRSLKWWVEQLIEASNEQWGMYSEGFREAVYNLTTIIFREKCSTDVVEKVRDLLDIWREHTLDGVENRHELVPEILKMIPLFVEVGAIDKANSLYKNLLLVSMGPSWYKEDQLGLMNSVLSNCKVDSSVIECLPKIAGLLEKASGEMTFQRFVRREKSILIGNLTKNKLFTSALAYFRRQSCGTTKQLWEEGKSGNIDNLGPLKGNRYPGGGVDEQEAILEIVKNAPDLNPHIKLALLEIFNCGDLRYLQDYATECSAIANSNTELPGISEKILYIAVTQTPSHSHIEFATHFKEKLDPELHSKYSKILCVVQSAPKEIDKPKLIPKAESEEYDDKEFFFPGIFGTTESRTKAGKLLSSAEKLLTQDIASSKSKAIEALKILQKGKWDIWDYKGLHVKRLKEIINEKEGNDKSNLRYYTSLIENDSMTPKWIIAERIIQELNSSLDESDLYEVLKTSLNHTEIIVGNSEAEEREFEFLGNVEEQSAESAFFQFILWLCDHPKWHIRERAASSIYWLLKHIPSLDEEAIKECFSMNEGFGRDILGGFFDNCSIETPDKIWEKIESVVDTRTISQQLQHSSRKSILHRIASRAKNSRNQEFIEELETTFGIQRKSLAQFDWPSWADCLRSRWRDLETLIDKDSLVRWKNKLRDLSLPISIEENFRLENAVSNSFRENTNQELNRWVSKVGYSLNVALANSLTIQESEMLETTLRAYNPNFPENKLIPWKNPVTEKLLDSVESGDFSESLCSSRTVILNHHEVIANQDEETIEIEVLCVLYPVGGEYKGMIPKLDKYFRSSEIPESSISYSPFQTCCRNYPQLLFLGSLTPSIPLPFFGRTVHANPRDFDSKVWKWGINNNISHFGLPEREGCSLTISKRNLKIPNGLKLAWLIYFNGELVKFIDEDNNSML